MAKEVILEAVLEGERVSAEQLLAIPGFDTIPKEKHERFPGAIVRRTFSEGSNIILQGEHGTTGFYILSGTADLFVAAPSAQVTAAPSPAANDGWFRNVRNLVDYLKGTPVRQASSPSAEHRESSPGRLVGTVGPGDIVGELEALNALKEQKRPRAKFYPRAATMRATSEVVVLEMLPNYLNGVLYPSPAFKEKLNRTYKSRAIEFTIRSSPVFRNLGEDLLVEICSRAELADFEPDQVICHRGDEVRYLDFIRLGFVKLSQAFPGGELVLAYLSRNAYFGEGGLLPVLRVRTQGGQPDHKAECIVSTTPIAVGRAAMAADDLAIPWDEYISRGDHAELSVAGNRLKVVRRQGKNPIGYGGALVDSARVAPGETFVLGQTTFEVEEDPLTNGRHPATCAATDFVQLVRIPAEDFPRILEDSADAASAIAEVARGRRQIESQLLRRVQQVSLEDFLDHDLMQGQNLLLLDLDRCTRCDECVKACAATHAGGAPRLVRDGLRFQQYLVATSCRACMDPLCMTHCPVGAIRRKGSSLDIVIEDWCIGCSNCAQDCPYGAINVMDLARTNGHSRLPSAEQAPKPRAVVCDLCHDFAEPNCVRACPHDAAIRVQPRFFFARDLAGVQLAVTPKLPPLLAEAHNETKIFSSASELLKLIPRLELVISPGAEDPLPDPHPRSFLLRNPGSTSFGREAENDCVLRNDSVSKKQAIIECHGSRFVLRNRSEVNVTYVNDRPATGEVELHPGDVLEMGEVRLKFLVGQTQ